MARFWLKSLVFAMLVTGGFGLIVNLQPDDGSGAKARGLAVIASVLRAALVDPLGLPLALAAVATATLAFCGFFALGRADLSEHSDPGSLDATMSGKLALPVGADIVGYMDVKRDFDMLNRPPANMFGRKKATAPPALAEAPAEPTRLTDPAAIALRAIKGDGLDWYFAHYGFEGNWRQAHAGLLALGQQQLANILARAGECYDRYIDEVFTPAGGEPSQQDDQHYGNQMRALGQEWRAANPPEP